MFVRFCCRELKEYYTARYCIIGVRRAESTRRAKRYHEPIQCRVFDKSHRVQQIMPILEWTDKDCLDFINDRKIKLHPLYYKKDGSVDITKRLGCMCCPMTSNRKRREQFRMYPKMLRQYVGCFNVFLKNHPNVKQTQMYKDGCEKMYRELYFTNQQKFEEFRNGLFKIEDDFYKRELEKEFNVNLDFNDERKR